MFQGLRELYEGRARVMGVFYAFCVHKPHSLCVAKWGCVDLTFQDPQGEPIAVNGFFISTSVMMHRGFFFAGLSENLAPGV